MNSPEFLQALLRQLDTTFSLVMSQTMHNGGVITPTGLAQLDRELTDARTRLIAFIQAKKDLEEAQAAMAKCTTFPVGHIPAPLVADTFEERPSPYPANAALSAKVANAEKFKLALSLLHDSIYNLIPEEHLKNRPKDEGDAAWIGWYQEAAGTGLWLASVANLVLRFVKDQHVAVVAIEDAADKLTRDERDAYPFTRFIVRMVEFFRNNRGSVSMLNVHQERDWEQSFLIGLYEEGKLYESTKSAADIASDSDIKTKTAGYLDRVREEAFTKGTEKLVKAIFYKGEPYDATPNGANWCNRYMADYSVEWNHALVAWATVDFATRREVNLPFLQSDIAPLLEANPQWVLNYPWMRFIAQAASFVKDIREISGSLTTITTRLRQEFVTFYLEKKFDQLTPQEVAPSAETADVPVTNSVTKTIKQAIEENPQLRGALADLLATIIHDDIPMGTPLSMGRDAWKEWYVGAAKVDHIVATAACIVMEMILNGPVTTGAIIACSKVLELDKKHDHPFVVLVERLRDIISARPNPYKALPVDIRDDDVQAVILELARQGKFKRAENVAAVAPVTTPPQPTRVIPEETDPPSAS